ncbi:sensor histidine kinase [Cellulomonas telluris]|uniref:sensor histidine kinase n=1 Tax=Cellulomonas telluris TaxID=2306636 RepID=UPI0010A8BD0A|nr:histidine kinase [Cellulomonas telluris]
MSDPRRLADAWRRLPLVVRDLPLAVVLALSPLVPALQGQGTQLGHVPQRSSDALTVAVVALQSAPLALRRRLPLVCLALVVTGFAVDQLRGYHTTASIGLPIALLSTGLHLDRFRRTTAALAVAAYVALAVGVARQGGGEDVGGYVAFLLALAVAWGAGAWLRGARAAEAAQRRRVADASRGAERARIARELHDVVTHHVTAMVVQTEAARYLTADPGRLDATLAEVGATGRRAIGDLRHLLDVLDPDATTAARRPASGDVRELVEQARRAGQPVEHVEEGRAALTTGSAAVAVHRVVQEALTNALKHAHGRPTTVRVQHGEEEVTVEVVTQAPGPGTLPRGAVVPAGGGRGLTGLRARVALLGGDLEAGARSGGWVVRARVPQGDAT